MLALIREGEEMSTPNRYPESVIKQIILRPEVLGQFPQMVQDAISRAIYAALPDIRDAAMDFTPEVTGELKRSFKALPTPRGLYLAWTAPHAEIVELGRSDRNPFPGRYYAEQTKEHARVILYNYIAAEFNKLQGGS